jgi:6-phosphogluconate dehydrogenase
MKAMKGQADIGLIGLAVMGQNLVLNMNDHGFTVAVFNRTVAKVDAFLKKEAAGTQVIGTHSVQDFVATLKRPRKIMLMVKAGVAVDELIEELLPFLEKGDIIIDGGNSEFLDTNRRTKDLKAKGILFIGTGISGGEEGARHGPSIMPGGNPDAWDAVKPIFQAIAAKTPSGEPCCEWVGDDGAGHFVKMVHNGIEYGDMQLIAETYDFMHRGMGLKNPDLEKTFAQWNKGVLDSYLIEITAKIFAFKENGGYLIDQILDAAKQKGTGKWTAVNALELGVPLTLIAESVFARALSSEKQERVKASEMYPEKRELFSHDLSDLHDALYASKITSYAQGFMLMRQAAKEYGWRLNFGKIALLWRAGCIIRSRFLENIKEAFQKNPNLENLFLDPFFVKAMKGAEKGWRKSVSQGVIHAIPMPCHAAALSFFDGWKSARLPANLTQAQRDFFGAHTYERIDQPRGTFFHTEWAS